MFADTMSVNRFMKIRNNLHFVVDKPSTDDRLWKVRPIIDHVMKRCHELDVEENVCIDEQIVVTFKGQLDSSISKINRASGGSKFSCCMVKVE